MPTFVVPACDGSALCGVVRRFKAKPYPNAVNSDGCFSNLFSEVFSVLFLVVLSATKSAVIVSLGRLRDFEICAFWRYCASNSSTALIFFIIAFV